MAAAELVARNAVATDIAMEWAGGYPRDAVHVQALSWVPPSPPPPTDVRYVMLMYHFCV